MGTTSLSKRLAMVMLALGLAGTGVLAASIGEASVRPSDEPRGANFDVKSDLDSNFCVQANQVFTKITLVVSPCNGAKDNQRWLFAWTKNGPFVALGAQGKCWSAIARVNSNVQQVPCTFTSQEQFAYTSTQQISDRTGKWCMSVAKAIGNSPLSVVKCDKTKKNQVWLLGH